MSRFDGRAAIITGAASGIGKEIALRFAAEGGIPVIADLNLDAGERNGRRDQKQGRRRLRRGNERRRRGAGGKSRW